MLENGSIKVHMMGCKLRCDPFGIRYGILYDHNGTTHFKPLSCGADRVCGPCNLVGSLAEKVCEMGSVDSGEAKSDPGDASGCGESTSVVRL